MKMLADSVPSTSRPKLREVHNLLTWVSFYLIVLADAHPGLIQQWPAYMALIIREVRQNGGTVGDSTMLYFARMLLLTRNQIDLSWTQLCTRPCSQLSILLGCFATLASVRITLPEIALQPFTEEKKQFPRSRPDRDAGRLLVFARLEVLVAFPCAHHGTRAPVSRARVAAIVMHVQFVQATTKLATTPKLLFLCSSGLPPAQTFPRTVELTLILSSSKLFLSSKNSLLFFSFIMVHIMLHWFLSLSYCIAIMLYLSYQLQLA